MDSSPVMNTVFSHGGGILISGSSGSGKSSLCRKIVLDRELLFGLKYSKIYWCYTVLEDALLALQKKIPNLVLVEGPRFDFNENVSNPSPVLCVYDDFHTSLTSKEFEDLFIYKCSKRNLTAILMMHSLFLKNTRLLSINARNIIVMRSLRDYLQVQNLGRQLYPANPKFLTQVYEDCTKEPYSYLCISCSQNTERRFKLRSSLWPDAVLYKDPF